MRPTRRGLGVAVVAAGAILAAWVAGARSLNAVAAPALIALAAGGLQVRYGASPVVTRTDPAPGHPGERRSVELTVEGGGLASIRDDLPVGVAATGRAVDASLPASVSYDAELAARGAWRLGPPRIVVTDVLGLFAHRHRPDATAEALVYPTVVDLRESGVLARLLGPGPGREREAFETVREYEHGDPLRDVHWPSSAKRPDEDLLVTEFESERLDDGVHVAADAAPGYADAMAAAAASLARHALDAGRSVAVSAPDADVPTGRGRSHERRLFASLATVGPGRVDEATREDADVIVSASEEGVVATVGEETYRLRAVEERTRPGSPDDGDTSDEPRDRSERVASGSDTGSLRAGPSRSGVDGVPDRSATASGGGDR